MRKGYLFFAFMWMCLGANGQSAPEALKLIKDVTLKFNKVRDYQVDALIDARISFLKILPQQAKVFYKAPNKFNIESKGIAILPKQNFDQLFSLLNKESNFMAFISGTENLNDAATVVVNVVPLADTSDLVLAKLWVDATQSLIVKSQLTTKSNGTVLIEYFYRTWSALALPDKTIFTVDVKRFKIPKAISADINSKATQEDKNKPQKPGRIIINFSNYKINKGIDDKVFLK
jgi:outer membrane lipoprotein-sorting protein